MQLILVTYETQNMSARKIDRKCTESYIFIISSVS